MMKYLYTAVFTNDNDKVTIKDSTFTAYKLFDVNYFAENDNENDVNTANDIAKETLGVLEYFDDVFVSKIPGDIKKKLEELAINSDFKIKIDKSKKLNEQEISEECKSLICLIYYNYFANEEEKKEILNIWNENERLYQEELSQKYKIYIILKNEKQNNDIQENLLVVKENKNIFQKIWGVIEKIFKSNE